jgi:membrane protein implicated in regulation of membrane protease activity
MTMVKNCAIVPVIKLGRRNLFDKPSAIAKPSLPAASGDRLGRWKILDLFAIPGFMLGYAALAFGLCALFGHPHLFVTDYYLLPFWTFYATGIAIALSVFFALRFYRRMVGRPEDRRILGLEMPERAQQLFGRIAIALPILLAMPLFMTGFTALKNLSNVELPFSWDAPLHDLDRWIHLGRLPWQWIDLRH